LNNFEKRVKIPFLKPKFSLIKVIFGRFFQG
jgi:hypothetical protein